MAIGEVGVHCPFCGEAMPAGLPPPLCPLEAEPVCPLVAGTRLRAGDGPEGEVIIDRGESDLLEADGFPAVDDLTEGMLGQYRMGAVIGRGAMGRVYRAEHTGLGRPCAVKVLDPGLVLRQPLTLERFWAEARAVAGLIHPHVVTVHNLGSDRGYHYIEMEYVRGGISLREALVRNGALDLRRATGLTRQVVLALGAAHRADLVHRDVKPANVLLTADGHAKLADFGLVRHLDDDAPVAGTPAFMAPELFSGAPPGPGTDLYAVGVMYFYLLTGRLPFTSGRLARLIQLHRQARPPEIGRLVPGLPEAVGPILDRCLAKRPEDRYAAADELADDLQDLLFGLRDPADLVRECLDGLECIVEGGGDHFRVLLIVPGGRLHEVHLTLEPGLFGRRLLTVYSVCAPADPQHFEFALRLNADLAYGGLSIRDVDGRPMFVMSRSDPGLHARPQDIRAAIVEIARRGDWVERQLTRADVY